MQNILERLKTLKNRDLTNQNYLSIWRQFNKFVLTLDYLPKYWEDWVAMYAASLIQRGLQSATLKSYISAIKSVLIDDNYEWKDERIVVRTLTRACRKINDRVKARFPLHIGLLELLIFQLQKQLDQQPYLLAMYKSFFLLSYYGLFRPGELASGAHPVRAKDVHIGSNKDKILLILYTSKTHGYESRPQQIKIQAKSHDKPNNRHFCPFKASREFLAIRGNYTNTNDPFFVFCDNSLVRPHHVRKMLASTLTAINLNPRVYNLHSFRIGRSSDMVKAGYTVEEVRIAGRWKSNTVYKYIRYVTWSV